MESCCGASKPAVSELIDVREAEELAEFSLPGVKHWPLSKILRGEFPDIPRDQKFVLICRSGARAERAASLFHLKGYENVSFTRESIFGYRG
jgi:sulfur-carrier protein adenylyltransferase/sulfurtransferase